MEYDKPHLTFPEQIEHLRERGLSVLDEERAANVLRRVGYYRLSAYAYPLRVLLPENAPRTTSVQHRADQFVEGADFDLVEALWSFDRDLRLLLMDALETIEIGLRVQISYVLGRRSTFGHLDVASLDAAACGREGSSGRTLYEEWVDRHQRTVHEAVSEDFVRHYVEKYDARLPIWVATEVMEFGSLVRLYGFLRDDDRGEIARSLGTLSGSVMFRWLKSANYVRNLVAHHARVWNRRLTYSIARPSAHGPAPLVHLRRLDDAERRKVYSAAAVVAHIVRSIDGSTTWPRRFAALSQTFPTSELVSVERDMGFPSDWREGQLWL